MVGQNPVGWLLETVRAGQQTVSTASTADEIGSRLPDALVEPAANEVAWIGQLTPEGGVRVRASSQPLPELIEISGEDSRTARALATGEVQIGGADPEYRHLQEADDVPAVETTVTVPLETAGKSVVHLYTDGELPADAELPADGELSADGAVFETLGGVITTGIERARLSAELDRERDRLEALRSLVSHDFGNPLNLAAGRLDLVSMECESEHIEYVEKALWQIDELTDEGNEFVKVGRPVAEREPVSLEALGRDSWAYANAARGTLDIEDATVTAEPERFRRLLDELIANSFDHTEGEVAVEIGPLEGREGFYVADDGPGIPDDDRAVFDRGYTTDSERDGNGLAVVDEIVSAHGWTVRLADSPGTRVEILTSRW